MQGGLSVEGVGVVCFNFSATDKITQVGAGGASVRGLLFTALLACVFLALSTSPARGGSDT